MNQSLTILPSARSIRNRFNTVGSSTLFLPNYITMSDFISKLCIVKDFKTLDEDTRTLLLLEASDFKTFSDLKIERNFFTFTKNSSFIFKFFQELSAEEYDIKDLSRSDIYGEYEEHIAILQELYGRYESLCNKMKMLDKIFLPKLYTFNESYAKIYKNIELYVEGHLTNFEFKLIQKCCDFTDVYIIFSATRFNTKMQHRFLDIDLQEGFEYKIFLNQKEIIEKKEIVKNRKIVCESFSEPILQVAFIQKKIYDFVKMGYKPENIVLVVPDESSIDALKLFDEKSNFNFAMGEPFNKRKIYEKLDATCRYIEQNSKENEARVKRVGTEFIEDLFGIYYKSAKDVDLLHFLQKYMESFSDKQELKIYEEELYSFKNIIPFMKELSVKSLLSLFLTRLSKRAVDDVRGGKITVMGVLETRLVEFDAVIIMDFSDSNVPKKSDKDLFLNSHIRESANLPTMGDRENLQKHYYEMLINRSKEVAICFVKSKESRGSRFLKQLGIKEKNLYDEVDYAKLLLNSQKKVSPKSEQEIVLEYSFRDKKLSATKLKVFLTCRRNYYYKYIKEIKNHQIPKDMPQEYEVGLSVHTALKNLYSKKNFYEDLTDLKRDLHKELDAQCSQNELEKYLIAMQKRRMDDFCQMEIQRFADGWIVEKCEERVELSFSGVILEGVIDRVDKKGGEIYVLDYKTGSYPLYSEKNFTQATDFQLEFYYLLASKYGEVVGCGYYDLKESKIVDELFLKEKLQLLESHIKDLLNIESLNFSKCEDMKNCTFCDYKTICDRE